jgi:hypothetical protein
MRTLRLVLAVVLTLGLSSIAGAEVWLNSKDAQGHPFSLGDLRGKIVALTFAGRHTEDDATEINDELANGAGGDMEVVCVVDLSTVPHVGHKTALKRITESDRPGVLQHLVDERGSLHQSFDVRPDARVDILIIDKNGELAGRYQGLQGVPEAKKKIAELRARGG